MANIDINSPGASANALRAALAKQGAGTFAQSAAPQSVTGTTSETTLATITIPGGAMGANGRVEVMALFSYTNSANNKTLRVKFGGTTMANAVPTTSASYAASATIANRNSVSSQVANGSLAPGATGAAVAAATADTTADVVLTITGQLANAGETITLESYSVALRPSA